MKPENRSLENIRRFLMEDPPQGSEPARTLPDLPRYRFGEKLGEGAMAVVYQAWDRELDRPVAVKLIRFQYVESTRRRFEREVRSAAAIAHANVVKTFDSGEKDGHLFLVMELVQGTSLGEMLRSGKLDLQAKLRIFLQAALGTAALHERGITHRDLKPANILVTDSGIAKIGDFGLAHWVETETPLTRTGALLGTPLYMAPEQARGQSKSVTPRTDVYALGAILYEILTGRPPHLGEDLLDIFAKVAQDEVVPPRSIDPLIPPALEAIALKGLRKDPERRYADAGELAEDLSRYLQEGQARATVRHPLTGLRQAIRRRARWIAAGAIAVAAIAALAKLDSERRREAARRQAEKDAELAKANFSIRILKALNDLSATMESMRRLEDYNHGAPLENVRAVLAQVEGAADEIAAKYPDTRLPPAWKALARMYAERGKPYPELEEIRKSAGEDPFPALLMGRAWLARYVGGAGLTPSMRRGNRVTVGPWVEDRAMRESRIAFLEHFGAATAKATWSHLADQGREYLAFARAAVAFSEGRWEEAEAILQPLQKHPVLGGDAANLRALSLRRLGRHEEAGAAWESLSRRGWVKAGHRAGLSLLDAATERSPRAEEMRPLVDRAVQCFKSEIELDYGEGAAPVFDQWGLALYELGKLAEARGEDPFPLYREALEKHSEAVRRDALHGHHRALVRGSMAALLAVRGRADEARREYEGAVADCEAALARDPGHRLARLNLAFTHRMRGQFETERGGESAPHFERARGILDGMLAELPNDSEALRHRGMVNLEWGAALRSRGQDPMPLMKSSIADFTAAIHIDPADEAAYGGRGNAGRLAADVALHSGLDPAPFVEQALADLDPAVSRSPEDGFLRFRRGYVHWVRYQWALARKREGEAEFEQAVADLVEAIRLRPNQALYHEVRAWVYEARARDRHDRGFEALPDRMRARDDYRRVIELDPRHPRRETYQGFVNGVNAQER